MLLTLVLDANNYGGVVIFFGWATGAVVLIGVLLWRWSKHIERQFDRDREPDSEPGAAMGRIGWLVLGFFAGLLLLVCWLASR